MRDYKLLTDKEKKSEVRTEILDRHLIDDRWEWSCRLLCSVAGCPRVPAQGVSQFLCKEHREERLKSD